MNASLADLTTDLASLVEVASRSLVRVRASKQAMGAGTMWHRDGLVVTAAHVVGNGPLVVTLDNGRELPAKLLARDPGNDLAALKVEATGLNSVPLGHSRGLRSGEWLMALGFPSGTNQSLVVGTFVGLDGATAGLRGSESADAREWLVVDLRLRPGFSGGALLDARGRLVGINTVMTGPRSGGAVPVHVAKRFLRDAFQTPGVAA